MLFPTLCGYQMWKHKLTIFVADFSTRHGRKSPVVIDHLFKESIVRSDSDGLVEFMYSVQQQSPSESEPVIDEAVDRYVVWRF